MDRNSIWPKFLIVAVVILAGSVLGLVYYQSTLNSRSAENQYLLCLVLFRTGGALPGACDKYDVESPPTKRGKP